MTIEQAIAELYSIRDFWLLPRHGDNGRAFEVREAVDLAVAALRAQKEREIVKDAPKIPCDLCRYNPPSSFGGKPCATCPAESGNVEDEDA